MDKAIKAGDLVKLKDLVKEAEKGTIDSSITKWGANALQLAASTGQVHLVKYLLSEAGASATGCCSTIEWDGGISVGVAPLAISPFWGVFCEPRHGRRSAHQQSCWELTFHAV
jgi:hypothetical protein